MTSMRIVSYGKHAKIPR